eukprot:CAMPEP_0116871402 /NCGR_PEP_ID=MMETSP0463-20121206/1728_1 /TAXON_ID=181622 /ORGANISM="Strombidinopsis sp, Strain SopsisLIS2011" /LENGTH=46 /DNA_ID= /DNA_START= /DNA_END= /DNA_ORIENTATION=
MNNKDENKNQEEEEEDDVYMSDEEQADRKLKEADTDALLNPTLDFA